MSNAIENFFAELKAAHVGSELEKIFTTLESVALEILKVVPASPGTATAIAALQTAGTVLHSIESATPAA